MSFHCCVKRNPRKKTCQIQDKPPKSYVHTASFKNFLCRRPSLHLFNKYLLILYSVPVTALGTGVQGTKQMELTVQWVETESKQDKLSIVTYNI